MGKALEIVLKEMCKRVGVNYNSVNFKEDGWYNQYSWSQEEEKEFINWLTDKLMIDKYIRMELLTNPSHLTYKKARKAAEEFVFKFGWKYPQTKRDQDYYD